MTKRKRNFFCKTIVAALSLGLAGTMPVTRAVADPMPTAETVDANILLGKLPKTNSIYLMDAQDGGSTVPKVSILNEGKATDGNKHDSSDDTNNTKIIAGYEKGSSDPEGKNGSGEWLPVYLQYDFEKIRDVKKINIYRNTYPNAISRFLDVKIELSEDESFSKSHIIYNKNDISEEASTKGSPQILDLSSSPVKAKYIRIWQRGHFITNTNSSWKGYSNGCLFNEIEVIAPVAKSEVPVPPAESSARNIALHKTPYVRGLVPTNLKAITDGKADGNFMIHNSLGSRFLQFEYKNTYNFKKIKFKLESGTYKEVKISVHNVPFSGDRGIVVFHKNNIFLPDDFYQFDLPKDVRGKCVRFTVNRNDNSPTKYDEIELWATGTNFDESKPEYQAPASEYNTLVWQDEFNGDAIDEEKWNIIDGMANHGAIYNRKAVSIKKEGNESYLAINTKNYETTEKLIQAVGYDKYQDQVLNRQKVTWSSGRLESKNKFSFQFGRIAVRAKVNDSKGIWPAIWMLCQDETGHDEIDILEYLGQNSWSAWTTNHFGILDHNKESHGRETHHYEAYSEDFHVYEAEWTPDIIKFFIDGKLVHTTDRGKNDKDAMHTRPMFPILETQVGDGWVGDVDYQKQDTKQDSDYLIDYVRVYQKAEQPVVRFDDLASLQPSANRGYHITPSSHTAGLIQLSTGALMHEDKNNFFYGGQPRYETNRLAQGVDAKEEAITYHIPDAIDVHLTAYYQTLSDYKEKATYGYKGKSIRETLTDGANLDFAIYTSKDGKTFTKFEKTATVNNYPEATPSYARITFDAYGLPEGTDYVKIVFPTYKGKKYKLNSGVLKDVTNTDIQLAKVTFLQKYQKPAPPKVTPEKPNQSTPLPPVQQLPTPEVKIVPDRTEETPKGEIHPEVDRKKEDAKKEQPSAKRNRKSSKKAKYSLPKITIRSLKKAFSKMPDGTYTCKLKFDKKIKSKILVFDKSKHKKVFILKLPRRSKKEKNGPYIIRIKQGRVINARFTDLKSKK